jgi:hypothetical protein
LSSGRLAMWFPQSLYLDAGGSQKVAPGQLGVGGGTQIPLTDSNL